MSSESPTASGGSAAVCPAPERAAALPWLRQLFWAALAALPVVVVVGIVVVPELAPVPYEPDPWRWESPTWQALAFAPEGPHYYAYQYDSAGVRIGSTFTASAFGDLDGDGVFSTFVRVGRVEYSCEICGGAGIYIEHPLE